MDKKTRKSIAPRVKPQRYTRRPTIAPSLAEALEWLVDAPTGSCVQLVLPGLPFGVLTMLYTRLLDTPPTDVLD